MATRSKHQGRNIRRVPLARAIATFFLLFTAGDILLPQYFCPNEWRPLPIAAQQALPGWPVNPDTLPDAPVPEDSSRHEEDCFCCCAHVLPPALLSLAGRRYASLPSQEIIVPTTALPFAPHQAIYHPPRFV